MLAQTNANPRILTVAITGASGSILPRHLLDALERDERVGTINLIVSDSGLRVMAEELGVTGRNEIVAKLLGRASSKIQQQNNADIGANVASGSYATDAMIVLPCSMGTLARIANGMAIQLIERAADVCLKERRPLILCVRETPFNRIHLRNMTLAAEAGRDHLSCHSGILLSAGIDRRDRARICESRAGACGIAAGRRVSVEGGVVSARSGESLQTIEVLRLVAALLAQDDTTFRRALDPRMTNRMVSSSFFFNNIGL